MRWSESQLESVIEFCFPTWSAAGKKKLLGLTCPAMSPGLIMQLQAARFNEADLNSPIEDTMAELVKDVGKRADDWAKFEDAEKKLKTAGY